MENNQKNDQNGKGTTSDSTQKPTSATGKMDDKSTNKTKDSNPKREFDDTDHDHKHHTIVDKKKQESEHKSDVKTNEHSATKQDNSKEGTKK